MHAHTTNSNIIISMCSPKANCRFCNSKTRRQRETTTPGNYHGISSKTDDVLETILEFLYYCFRSKMTSVQDATEYSTNINSPRSSVQQVCHHGWLSYRRLKAAAAMPPTTTATVPNRPIPISPSLINLSSAASLRARACRLSGDLCTA